MHIWDSPEIIRLVTVLLGLAILWFQARVSRKQDVIACFTEANAGPTKSDPSGLIPGWCSYRCHYTTTPPPDTTMRIRLIDAASGLS